MENLIIGFIVGNVVGMLLMQVIVVLIRKRNVRELEVAFREVKESIGDVVMDEEWVVKDGMEKLVELGVEKGMRIVFCENGRDYDGYVCHLNVDGTIDVKLFDSKGDGYERRVNDVWHEDLLTERGGDGDLKWAYWKFVPGEVGVKN